VKPFLPKISVVKQEVMHMSRTWLMLNLSLVSSLAMLHKVGSLQAAQFKSTKTSADEIDTSALKFTDWTLCDAEIHSNLGGLGPDDGDENIRYSNVATTVDGIAVDLLVTNQTTYLPKDSSLNKVENCLGRISVSAGEPEKVGLLFKFVESGTEEAVAASNYLFSAVDIDKGSSGTEKVTFVTAVSKYWTRDTNNLEKSGSKDDDLAFKAEASAVDNPENFPSLTTAQKKSAVTVYYEDVTQFKVRLSLKGASGKKKEGRSFFFGGWSALAPTLTPTPSPTPEPTPVPTPEPTAYVSWSLCDVTDVHSNLGGMGPDSGDENMRLSNVATLSDGTAVDLLITNNTEYVTKKSSKNAVENCLGRIQIYGGSPKKAEFLFKFVESGTETKLDDRNYYFSMVDIDKGSSTGKEKVIFESDVDEYYLADSSDLSKSGSLTDELTFTATETNVDNPESFPSLTKKQKKSSVTVKFAQSWWKVRMQISGQSSKEGRSFFFGAKSSLVD
jgi:hypothetical protein